METMLDLFSRIFRAGSYLGLPMRIQQQDREVIREVGGQELITMATIAIIDWCDLPQKPVYGDAVVLGPKSFRVRSYLLQGDGFARIELDNAQALERNCSFD